MEKAGIEKKKNVTGIRRKKCISMRERERERERDQQEKCGEGQVQVGV